MSGQHRSQLASAWSSTRARATRVGGGGIAIASLVVCLIARSNRTTSADTSGASVAVSTRASPAAAAPSEPGTGPRQVCLALAPVSQAAPHLDRSRLAVIARPGQPDAWVELGRAWLALSQRSADPGFALHADACASVALALAPDHAGALGVRSLVALTAHEFEQAKALAEAVLDRFPEDMTAWGASSDALLELGDVAGAERAAQRLLDIKPGLPAYSRAAYLRWLHGQVPGAIELMRLAIDAAGDPEDGASRAWALTQTALLFWHEADYDGAEAGFQMALGVEPSHAPALVGLGRVATTRGDYARAATSYRQALTLHPDVETATLLGDVLAWGGDAAGSAESYRRAEQLGRSDRRGLSLSYSTRGIEPEAALRLARAEYASRADIYTEDALAWALYRNGELAEALTHIARARRLSTPDARLIFHHGAILLTAGQPRRGRTLLRQALSQNPHFDLHGANEARRLLGASPS